MALKLETYDIKDAEGVIHTYEVNQMPGRKALKGFLFWATILSSFMGALTKMESDEQDEVMLGELMANIDNDKLMDNIEDLLKKEVLRDGQPIDFDEDYRGNIGEAFEIAVKVLKLNYESLWGSSLGKMMTGVAS